MGIHPGDKILIMKHPLYKGLVMFKIDAARNFLDEFGSMLTRMDDAPKEEVS